jgi:hypothetical protein
VAVTIEEMHVDVKEATAPASAPAVEADPNKGINLREAMQLLRQRTERLQAD